MTDALEDIGGDDDREVVDAQDLPGEPPVSHLAPVMVPLVAAGNPVTYPQSNFGFVPQQDGWHAYLDHPIDVDLVERRFVLPPTIHLDRDNDHRRRRVLLARVRRRRAAPAPR